MRPVLAAILAPILTVALTLRTSGEPEPDVVFASSTDRVACYEFVEVAIHVAALHTAGPASTVLIDGTFGLHGQEPIAVAGFRDAADGSVHRIRFMPSSPGQYAFTVRYREGAFTRSHEGTFVATDARAKGIIRADPHFPGALLWDGSKERFFWSGLEAGELLYLEPAALQARLEQLDGCRITGLRIAATATTDKLDTWARVERLLELARARHIVVTIALPNSSGGGDGTSPSQRLAYTTARLAAFNNVIWELPASDAAALAAIRDADPYHHLTMEPAPSLALEACTHGANTLATTIRPAWRRALEGSSSTLSLPDSPELAAGDAIEEVLAPVGHLYDFFTGMPWWELHPEPALLVALHPHGSRTGAPEPHAWAARNTEGDLAAIYVAGGGVVTVSDAMLRDQLKPLWFSPRDGGMRNARALRDRVYRTPTADDWVLLFRTPCNCSFRDFDNEFE